MWNTVPSVEACRPTLDVDERRNPQSAVGNGGDDEQSAGPLAEIAPLSSGHDILRIDDTGSRSRFVPYICRGGLFVPKANYPLRLPTPWHA